MNRTLLVGISIIILLIFWASLIFFKWEHFGFDGIRPKLHAVIDRDGSVIYYSWQSARANGEDGCAVIKCPDYIDDNITCWGCYNYN